MFPLIGAGVSGRFRKQENRVSYEVAGVLGYGETATRYFQIGGNVLIYPKRNSFYVGGGLALATPVFNDGGHTSILIPNFVGYQFNKGFVDIGLTLQPKDQYYSALGMRFGLSF